MSELLNQGDRVVIAFPSTDQMPVASALCLASMFSYCVQGQVGGRPLTVTVHNKKGSCLSELREGLCELALENNATHVLFVDSDQTYPHDTLHRLLAHKKPVVACNVATKKMPPDPTARAFNGTFHGEPIFSFPGVTGLEKVWRIGTGVMLIATFILPHIPKPWFPVQWDAEQKMYKGEDWSFCEGVQKAGYDIFIDHDLSREIGHVGSFNYKHALITSAALSRGLITERDLDCSTLSERRFQ